MSVVQQPDSSEARVAASAVTLRGVGKMYPSSKGRVDALHGIDLEIARGEFVEVRGPSGAGKSTLLALIGGLAKPTRGEVLVLGQPLDRLSASQRATFRREHVGFVFQLFHLLPYLNVCDNVLLAAARRTAEAKERAETLLRDLGLADRMTHRPGQLSAGERQRVALARALFHDPELLLADEPTGNLDAENATVVMEHLERFQQAGGTVILVTHDDRAARAGRRVIRLVAGRLETSDRNVASPDK